MNFIPLYFALFYLIPFCIALAMFGWRSLLVYGLTVGTLIVWAYVSGSNGGGNGLAVALGLGMVMFAGAGLLSGVITRAILLTPTVRTKTVKVRALIIISGIFVLPILIFSQMKWFQWSKRPPSEACLNSKYPIRIAGAILYLPPAPNLTVWTDKNSLHLFQNNEGIRAICDSAKSTEDPIHVMNLRIDNRRVQFKGYPVQGRYCQTTTARWGKDLCSSEYRVEDANYPITADVYSQSEFNSDRRLPSNSYENFITSRERAKSSNGPFTFRQVGEFDRYGDGPFFLVAHGDTWENEAGEPYTLHCYQTTPVGFLLCTATYRLKAGPHLSYQFHTPENDVATVARRVDENIRAMITELSQP